MEHLTERVGGGSGECVSPLFACALCEEHPTFEGKGAFGEHCRAAHPDALPDQGAIGVDVSLVASKDGADWYENTFRGTLPDGRPLFEVRVAAERDPDEMPVGRLP
jgi:hypothetical protein